MYKQDEGTLPLLEQALTQLPYIVLLAEMSGSQSADARIVFANGAALAQTGFALDDVVGKHPSMLWSEDADTDQGAQRPILQPLQSTRSECRIKTKTGKALWAELHIIPLAEAGKPSHYLIVADDTGERRHDREIKKQLQEQLFQSQKMESIGVLASGIAHDFNNILTGIVGGAELIKMSLPQPHPAHEDLDNIMQAAQRAAALTRELLAYASANAPRADVINLNQMVTGILVILRSQMSRSIIVRKALMPDVPNVEADAVQIQQIMMNLCLNASDAMQNQGGVLSITTDRTELDEQACDECVYLRPQPGVYAVFEVRDTGVGMDTETLKHIFQPFFSTKPQGRGLGLAVVQSIVKSYHGGIQVISEPGQGTTVRIFLPASGKDVPEKINPHSGGSVGTQTILLVDDEEILRSLGQRALERFGYRVLLAADGIEAVRIYRERAAEIDLVILDLSMPRKSGEDAYLEMRGIKDDMKILLCCGYNEAIASSKIAGEHIVGFLPKPYTIDALAQTVQAALNLKR